MFLNADSKFFVNTSINMEMTSHTEIGGLDGSSNFNFAVGIGYKFKDKLSIEIRKESNQNILNNYNTWEGKFSNASLILGYTIL